MTIEEKVAKVLAFASTCPYKVEHVIARLASYDIPVSGDLAEWLRKIGADDRIDYGAISPEKRVKILRDLMNRYSFNNQATAALLGCSTPLIAAYKCGYREIPIYRLIEFKNIIDAIEQKIKELRKMRKQTEAALKLAREKGLKPGDLVPVATYDEESYPILRNPDGMAFHEYNKVVEDVISTLSENGYRAVPVKIRVSEYRAWLGDDLNSAAKRAEFVAKKMKESG